MTTFELFNKVFERTDMDKFTTLKNDQNNIFDNVIGEFKAKGEAHKIHFTNDPVKLLGCGFRIESSYSPQSESFKYLPSFVLQDYIGMLYITDGSSYYIEKNGERIIAPNYLVRAFVMFNPQTKKILFKMPVYTDNNNLYFAFESIDDVGHGILTSDTVAPEIHLDVLDLLYVGGTNKGLYPKRHIAICGHQYPIRENREAWIEKMNKYKRYGKLKVEK